MAYDPQTNPAIGAALPPLEPWVQAALDEVEQLELIFDDGKPMETFRHRIAMTILIDALETHWSGRRDFHVGGNAAVYYSVQQVRNRDFLVPDFFCVRNVIWGERPGWVVWRENGRCPDVIVELLSPTTAVLDRTTKKDIYERMLRVSDYFLYDPFDFTLEGWRLIRGGSYRPLTPDPRGWLWSEELQLWLGTWVGTYWGVTTTWLRFYTPEGQLVPLGREQEAQRADAEHQQAEAERQLAEVERQRAHTERHQAEAERQRAEAESQRAEVERQRAEAALAEVARLQALLAERRPKPPGVEGPSP